MPVIEVVNVSKSFGRKVVLDGVNLGVEEGESLVVLGGSGSGKTVLLRCILGLFRPEAGHVVLEGRWSRTSAGTSWPRPARASACASRWQPCSIP